VALHARTGPRAKGEVLARGENVATEAIGVSVAIEGNAVETAGAAIVAGRKALRRLSSIS